MKQIFSRLISLKKECPVCNSTGKIICNCDEHYELSCPNCHGTGVVSTRKTTSQVYEVPCDHPACQKGTVPCNVCLGTGKNEDGTPCNACRGKGRVSCPVCGGIGKIKRVKQETWLEHEPCHICDGRGLVSCYQCHGTKERVCPECKGKGTVWNVGKIMLIAISAVIVIAMPVVIAVMASLALGYVLFQLEQQNKSTDKEQEEKVQTQTVHSGSACCAEDKKLEFDEIR